jgi:hypothetical protein
VTLLYIHYFTLFQVHSHSPPLCFTFPTIQKFGLLTCGKNSLNSSSHVVKTYFFSVVTFHHFHHFPSLSLTNFGHTGAQNLLFHIETFAIYITFIFGLSTLSGENIKW